MFAERVARARRAARVWLVRRRRAATTAQARFITSVPSAQTAIDAVPVSWASKLPPPLDGVRAGEAALFDDARIKWAFEQLGGVQGRSVLDLGPLEGGHSYMAQRAGAARVLGVEANAMAFLKCLVTKELLHLDRCEFVCGDVLEYLAASKERFDLCIASGLLYHMAEPLRLLDLISRRAQRLFMWTHVYAEEARENPALSQRLGPPQEHDYEGFRYRASRHSYELDHSSSAYFGGTAQFSNWMLREDLMRALDHLGWRDVRIAFDDPRTQNGPALALVAERGSPARGADAGGTPRTR